MPNCAVCGFTAPNRMAYVMHQELEHKALKLQVRRLPEAIRRPLTKTEKAEIVDRGEARLGKHHFFQGGHNG
jgi:hypothetical protein